MKLYVCLLMKQLVKKSFSMKNKMVDGIHAPKNNDDVLGWIFVGFAGAMIGTILYDIIKMSL
jgi:hypothetical protein